MLAATRGEEKAFAVGLSTCFRTRGGTVGVATGGEISLNIMKQSLSEYPQSRARASELARDATALVEIIRTMPHGAARQELRSAFVASMRAVFIVLTATSTAAMLSSLFIDVSSLEEKLDMQQALVEYGIEKSSSFESQHELSRVAQ